MNEFPSGVSSYVAGVCRITVFFPVDAKGVPHVRCSQCEMYRAANHRCGINHSLCEFPEKYVGSHCPLTSNQTEEGEPNYELDPEQSEYRQL